MSAPPDILKLADDVILVPIEDGSARLLDMGGSFFALSRSGREILEGAMSAGLAPTTAAMSARYGVEPSRIAADAERLIGELRSGGLIAGIAGKPVGALARVVRAIVPSLVRLPGVRTSPTALLLLARLCFVTLGWARTIDLWRDQHAGSLRPATVPADAAVLHSTDGSIRRAAARLPTVACKERSLAAWHVLARRGIASSLVVGIQLYPLAGHVWCEAAGQILTDFPDHCAAYRPIARYDLDRARPEVLAVPVETRASDATGGAVAWSR